MLYNETDKFKIYILKFLLDSTLEGLWMLSILYVQNLNMLKIYQQEISAFNKSYIWHLHWNTFLLKHTYIKKFIKVKIEYVWIFNVFIKNSKYLHKIRWTNETMF